MGRYKQGTFKPQNPLKYKGDITRITYRSSWELKFMSWLDSNPAVVRWSSEEIVIPYVHPLDRRVHRYFPDFWILIDTKNGREQWLVEIKPKTQSVKPERPEKVNRAYVRKAVTYGINERKWEAAKEYCDERGWKFQVLNESDLGIK